jgi:hypothetical protein
MVPVENNRKNALKAAALAAREGRLEAGTTPDRRAVDLTRTAVEPMGKRCRPEVAEARPRKPRNKLKGSVEGKRKDER